MVILLQLIAYTTMHAASISPSGKSYRYNCVVMILLKRAKEDGRPKDFDQEKVFLKMYSYLEENDEEQLTRLTVS